MNHHYSKKKPLVEILPLVLIPKKKRGFEIVGITAGFPSPAGDFLEGGIDLNNELIKHPATTFFARVRGYSMKDAGIDDGDLLVIDRSLEIRDGNIAVCFLDGEFTVKQIKIDRECCWLIPANNEFKPIKVDATNEFIVWGVVTYIIKKGVCLR